MTFTLQLHPSEVNRLIPPRPAGQAVVTGAPPLYTRSFLSRSIPTFQLFMLVDLIIDFFVTHAFALSAHQFLRKKKSLEHEYACTWEDLNPHLNFGRDEMRLLYPTQQGTLALKFCRKILF